MRATIYLGRKELRKYLESRGYKIQTLRKIITTEFGYPNSSKIREEFNNISNTALNITLAYKNQEEYRKITLIVSFILNFLRANINTLRIYGRDVIYINSESTAHDVGYRTGMKSEMLYSYTETTTFRREFIEEINEKLGLNEIRMSI